MAPNDDDPLRIGGVPRPGAAAAVDAAAATEAASAIDAVPAEIDSIDAVAGSLSAGAIDADGAVQALIESTTRAVLGPGADPAAVAAIREEVAALLAGDPTLAALLRP